MEDVQAVEAIHSLSKVLNSKNDPKDYRAVTLTLNIAAPTGSQSKFPPKKLKLSIKVEPHTTDAAYPEPKVFTEYDFELDFEKNQTDASVQKIVYWLLQYTQKKSL